MALGRIQFDSVLISYDSHFINIQGLCVWDEIRV